MRGLRHRPPRRARPLVRPQVCPTGPATRLARGFLADQTGTMADLAAADTLVVPGCRTVQDDPPAGSRARSARGACRGARDRRHLLGHVRARRSGRAGPAAGPPPTGCTPTSSPVAIRPSSSTPRCCTCRTATCSPRRAPPPRSTSASSSSGRTSARPPPTSSRAAWSCRRTARAARRSTCDGRCRSPGGGLPARWSGRGPTCDEQITVADLARRMNISPRTLIRRFHTPRGWRRHSGWCASGCCRPRLLEAPTCRSNGSQSGAAWGRRPTCDGISRNSSASARSRTAARSGIPAPSAVSGVAGSDAGELRELGRIVRGEDGDAFLRKMRQPLLRSSPRRFVLLHPCHERGDGRGCQVGGVQLRAMEVRVPVFSAHDPAEFARDLSPTSEPAPAARDPKETRGGTRAG